ncbi:MAG: VWA domain-containing protein [Hoeflea sp.]|uniref:vWA domain-containing protein n=1 Tax=Hoeflea sp. TaxID=1940281 RepID=UPI0032EC6097
MTLFKTCSAALLSVGLAVSGFAAKPAMAQDMDIAKAQDLVRLLFAKHTARFQAGDTPLMNEPGLMKRFLVDCLAVEGLQGRLQFDPIYGAQDADISDLRVFADPDAPILRGAAQIHLAFSNFGTPRLFIYTLIKAANGEWQINDIYSDDDGWTLTGLMREGGIANVSCDPGAEVTLFDPPAGNTQATNDSGMEDGDLPAHMDGGQMAARPTGSDPDADVGMEQGDTPAYTDGAGGSDLVFIVDASGSMWGQVDGTAKISTAKQALTGLIGDLGASTNVGLIAYGHRREGDCGDIETLLPVANHSPDAIGLAIDGITPRGKTPIAAALEAAASTFPAADRQANVLLISDGRETCGGDPCAAARALSVQGIKTRVHVVGFDLSEEESRALQCIAEEGNGNYYAANNAQEFVDAVNKAVRATEEETAALSEPEPRPLHQAKAYFIETFDGPEIDTAWSVTNEVAELKALDGKGALFIAASGKKDNYDHAEAMNRLELDKQLPDGDFDLVLDLRMALQTGREHVWLSIAEDPANQIGALFWADWKGCGPALHLSLSKLSGEAGAKPENTGFDISLFGGPMVDNICSKAPRAYGDQILEALYTDGATLRLKRRGRKVTAAVEMQLPAFEDYEARIVTVETEPVTALRLSGKPGIFAGQWSKAAPGESHYFLERFAIEEIAQ